MALPTDPIKFSELTAKGSALAGADILAVTTGGNSRSVTGSNILTYVHSATDSDDVGNESTVTGTTVSDALETLDAAIPTGALADLDTVDTAQIDNASVTIAKISATGTADATTFLRGDGSWQVVSGSGAVDSVNGETGVVVLDADDIDDTSTTNKFTTAGDISKLSGIEAGADVTDAANVAAAGAFITASDTLDDITAGTTNKHFTSTDETKLDSIATGAEVNTIDSDTSTDGVTGSDQITNATSCTSAEHTAGTTVSTMLYFITDAT